MGETTPQTPSPCEQLLDYVYGELDDAGKRGFEEHLGGCARCQTEVASLGRVRLASTRMLPSVEPTPQLTGALHAQLMHAAAQRRPRRGVLLGFPRRIAEHPAWAAAAMFAVVGGAIAINWSRDKMTMPAATERAEAPPPVEAAPASAALPPEAVVAKSEQAKGKAGAALRAADEKDSTRIALDAPPLGTLTVQRPAAHRAAVAAKASPTPPAKMKKIAAKSESVDALGDDAVGGLAGATSGPVGGAASGTGGDGRGSLGEGSAKSSAPQRLSRGGKAEEQPQQETNIHAYTAPSTASGGAPAGWGANAPPAATVPATPSPAPQALRREAASRDVPPPPAPRSSVQSAAAPARDVESLRKRADDSARSGRCDDAIKLYQQLDRESQYVTPTERANYVRCLTARGREDEALQQLEELKADKRLSNAQLQQVEQELSKATRRRTVEKKAAKKPMAAPADRAAQQQRAEPAPAAPPPQQQRQQQKATDKAY